MKFNNFDFNAFVQKHYPDALSEKMTVGRISAAYRDRYRMLSAHGESDAYISGKFRNGCKYGDDYPATGDWVMTDLLEDENKAVIQTVLPRKSLFSRKTAGRETREQVIAANIDYAFIVCALNYDFNLRRIERFLSMVWQSGAVPVIILTKPDLCDDVSGKVFETERIAIGVDIHVVNNLSHEGTECLNKYFRNNATAVLLGSSGVGKSSLINNLAGEEIMRIGGLRSDVEKGRHTTTHRQMIILPDGGMIIDTPGLRELQMWDTDEGIVRTFSDINELAGMCRFNDCTHTCEPGCAVLQAVTDGIIDEDRLNNFMKVRKEQEYLISRQTQSSAQIERNKWKSIHKQIKTMNRKGKFPGDY